MEEVSQMLSLIAQKIEGHPELRQAYTRVCNGIADHSTASQIAMLYKQLSELTKTTEIQK